NLIFSSSVNNFTGGTLTLLLNQPCLVGQVYTFNIIASSRLRILAPFSDLYSGGIFLLNGFGFSNSDFAFDVVQRNLGSSLTYVSNTGNVGIGTMNPTAKLEVVGSTKFNSLSGTGTRYVVADSIGNLSAQGLGFASTNANGILSSFDWNTFNNKQNTLSNASSTISGILTSADWNTFNNKGTFTLPSLTNGSVLFSNGSTISQNNSNFFWDNTNSRLGLGTNSPNRTLTVNSTNSGTGTTDWIASNVGGAAGDRVVAGILNGKATIGAHNNALNAWADLIINQSGNVGIGDVTAPTAKLDVNGSLRFRTGALANGILTSDANGNASWTNTIAATLQGNVTGDVTGNLTGNVTGNVTGDLIGNSSGIHNGSVVLGSSSISYAGGSFGLRTFSGDNLLIGG
ncbi:MAG: hypothetical protein ACOVOV_16740, partial [Dolichospermum sp.]